ncbi:MAG TPA: hypothetical protein VKR59_10920 [Terriglobales bacterium]|nr:hypothetical protein [Terriglobales bacterium]
MKSIPALLVMSLALASLAVAGGKGRVAVKVTSRYNSNVAYSYAFANGSYGLAQNLNLRGATFTLVLPSGDSAVVNCTSKFQERFAGPGNVRSCRVPLVDEFEATFDGDKAKLFWPTSLDGKKIESETYKIIAVSKAGTATSPAPLAPATTTAPPEPPTPSAEDRAKQAQQYADCLKAAVNNPSIVCQ